MSWAEAVEAAGRARRRFYEAAKSDIGVAIGRSAEAYEWQMSKWLVERPEGMAGPPADGGR